MISGERYLYTKSYQVPYLLAYAEDWLGFGLGQSRRFLLTGQYGSRAPRSQGVGAAVCAPQKRACALVYV